MTDATSKISPALGRVLRQCGSADIDKQLRELAEQFKLDAQAIDPSITGMWMYHDQTVENRDSAVQGVFFERPHAPLIQRRK